MKQFYSNGYSSKIFDKNNAYNVTTKVKQNLWYIKKGYKSFDRTYVIKTKDGYKIDWEASVCYNSMSLNKLKEHPGKVIEWREKYFCQSTSYDNESWDCYFTSKEYFYCKKDSKVDKSLKNIFDDCEYQSVIIKIKAVKVDDSEYFEIVDFIQKGLSKY